MGDLACVVHGHGYDSASPKLGNHLQVLGDSVSFGRFMSEPLSWEKWSTFSHKKYVEEAESYSRPGSVAQKKAFFEAHYKKVAAKKKAAVVEEETEEESEENGKDFNHSPRISLKLDTHLADEENGKDFNHSQRISLILNISHPVDDQKTEAVSSPVPDDAVNFSVDTNDGSAISAESGVDQEKSENMNSGYIDIPSKKPQSKKFFFKSLFNLCHSGYRPNAVQGEKDSMEVISINHPASKNRRKKTPDPFASGSKATRRKWRIFPVKQGKK